MTTPKPRTITATLPDRQALAGQFLTKDWFRNTDIGLQNEILSLPNDFDGFLIDLASRPDEIGELDVIKMTKLSYGQFLILSVFEVRSNVTNQVFSYEYVSWKTGRHSGARGIIFLETEGKITHFIVSRAHRFSTAEDSYESVGGLYLHFFGNKPQNLSKKLENEICFHLGVYDFKFKKVVYLGKAHPDLGMSNNTVDLFAAVIDISDADILTPNGDFRSTHKPVGFELEILRISEFRTMLDKVQDNFFLSAASRALVSKELSLEI